VVAAPRPDGSFYRGLGFQDCGQLARQILIDDVEDDEMLMELRL
jgi:hypothetical protein